MPLNRTTRHICALLIVGALGPGCSKGDDSKKEPPVAESPAQEANPGEPARAAAAKEEPEGEDTITFGSTGPEAYSSYEERVTVNMDMSMKLTRGDAVLQKGKVTKSSVESKLLEFIEVEDNTVNRVKVTWDEKAEATVADGEEETDRSELAGKTYVVVRDGDGIAVTDTSGDDVPDEEAKEVKKANDIKGFRTADAIKGETIKVGDTLDVPKAFLEDLLHQGDGGGKITEATMTFKEIKEVYTVESAVFDTAINMRVSFEDEMALDIKLTGTMTMGIASSALVQADLKGPIKLDASKLMESEDAKGMSFESEGYMKVFVSAKELDGDALSERTEAAIAAAREAEEEAEEEAAEEEATDDNGSDDASAQTNQPAATRARGVQKGKAGGPRYDDDDLPADNRYEEYLRMEREEREAKGDNGQ